jgi:drug/metabolite transporter (DMT)-like permease
MLFLASGFLDTYLKYNQEKLVPEHHQSWFTSSIFAGAALLGFIWIGVLLVNGKTKLEWKNLWAGIILGIPNYGSIYFLLKALGHEGNESSFIFPVNNVAIVAFSVISALLIFGEKLSKMNIVGILLAIVSILLINMDRF